TNDHEVRFFGDGDDIIARFWNDSLGLDPNDILTDSCQLRSRTTPHKALVARCSCGVIGCGDVEVEVSRSENHVEWVEIHGRNDPPSRTFAVGAGPESVATQVDDGDHPFRRTIEFPASQYETEVERALKEINWETPERTAARLVRTTLNYDLLASNGFSFDWASGRARAGKFTISLKLEPGPYQILVQVPWNDVNPEEIATRCIKLLSEPPINWSDAEWWPQQRELGPPPLAGPTWRKGG